MVFNSLKFLLVFRLDVYSLSICRNQFSLGFCSSAYKTSTKGPTFPFILDINDLLSVIKSNHILMYVDDVKLFSYFSLESHSYQLRVDLNNLFTWCSLNFIKLKIKRARGIHSPLSISTIHKNWEKLDPFMGFYSTKDYILICTLKVSWSKTRAVLDKTVVQET